MTIGGQTLTVTQAGSNYVAANPVTLAETTLDNPPGGMAVDSSGDVYMADSQGGAIDRWNPMTGLTTLISGLNDPRGLAEDSSGNLYIAEAGTNSIDEWNSTKGLITLVSSGLQSPTGVAVDSLGNLFIADWGDEAIYEWSARNGLSTPLVQWTSGEDNPTAVAVDSLDNVYIADSSNKICEWNATNGLTTLYDWTTSGSPPGSNSSLLYGGPAALTVDGGGNVYCAAEYDNAIEVYAPATNQSNQFTTLFSSGLTSPYTVAVDQANDIYFVDWSNSSSSYAIQELPRAFVPGNAVSEGAAAGSGQLQAVLPTNESLTGVFAPSSNQSWLTLGTIANGVVHFSFTANTSAARTADITVLGQQIAVTQAAGLSQTNTIVSSSLNSSTYGQSVIFTATVENTSDSDTPTGSVNFSIDGGTSQAGTEKTDSGNTATWTFSIDTLSAGTQSVVASYVGSGNFVDSSNSASPFSQTVNPAVLTITANNATKTYGQTLTFGAGSTAFSTGSGQLQNGNTIASVTITDTNSGGPATAAANGNYVLTPSAAVAGSGTSLSNYSITYDTGTLTVGTAPLTITANNATKTYGQAVTFGSGSTLFTPSGLENGETIGTVTLAVSGNGGATTAAVGSYTITPSLATGGTFTASNYSITYDTGTLTVGTAPLTITANAQSKTYGQTVTFGSGSTLFTPSGLENGETIGTVTLAVSGNGGATTAAVGSYTITPSLATGGTFTASNYSITYDTGTLTVGTAALTITANAQTKTYGQTVTFGSGSTLFTPSGLENGETIGTVTLAVSGNGGATTAAVGSYTITPSLATGGTFTASNYSITYDTGTLTVGTAALTITANAQTKTYGQTVTFGSGSTLFTPSGLENGETIGTVTLAVSGNGGATTAAVGSYTITPSLATGGTFTASNYSITYDTGTLTVGTAPLTITANAQSKTYGQTVTFGSGSTLFTPSGLENGETIGTVTLAVSGNGGATTAAVGSYTITPSLATGGTFTASNYSITYDTGTLTVGTAALTITANAQSKTYGQTVTFGSGSTLFTPSGLENGETIGTVTLAVSGNGGATTAAVGSYTITPSLATGGTFTASNYSITYDTGTLTVGTAALTITANAQTKTYGTALTLGTTDFTDSGLKNNDTVTGVTLTSSGAAATATVAGSPYTITPSAATGTGLSNYSITYDNGSLTVNKATPSISANPGATVVTGTSVSLTASAMLAGGCNETGSITFTLYNPSNVSVYTDTVTVTGTGTFNTSMGTSTGSAVPTSAGTYQWVAAYSGDGNNQSTSTTQTSTPEIAVGAGTTVVGSSVYLVGGNTTEQVTIKPAGTSNTGSTGIQVSGSDLSTTTFSQAFTTIYVVGFGGNHTISVNSNLTIAMNVSEGAGNNTLQLANGNNTVTVGNGNNTIQAGNGNTTLTAGTGNNTIQLGNGNNTVTTGTGNNTVHFGNGNNTVTAGNGNNTVTAGNGNNTVTVGNGNDTLQLGNGNNVVVEGNGTDTLQVGNGDNLLVGGLGKHTIQAGNGSNILIDGSVQLTQTGDSLALVLSDWINHGASASNISNISARLNVTYNTSNSNTLDAGSGLDWFWETYAQDHTNRKATDLLN